MTMKIIIAVLAVLLGAAAYLTLTASDAPDDGVVQPAKSQVPVWEEPIPEGTKLVEAGLAKIHVKPVRRNEDDRCWIDFHITEEHGYMVDGINLKFWYRFKDTESGDIIEDPYKIGYFVKTRLGFNETLVESTPLLEIEFKHIDRAEIAATIGDNWGTQVTKYGRAIEPIKD